MENNWKDFLYFSKPERNGLFVLLLLSLLLLGSPFFFSFAPSDTPTDFSVFQKEVDAFLSETEKQEEKTPAISIDSLFRFDPNTLAAEKFTLLGLPEKVVRNLLNYRNKGGRFFRKEELKKIYGMRTQDFQRLLPYITIDQQQFPKNQKSPPKKATIPPTFDQSKDTPPLLQNFNPNHASKAELIALGISPKAAQILLNFREKGGTFRKKEDLKKVFGISAANYQTLAPYIQLAPSTEQAEKKEAVEKLVIDINQATAEDWQQLKGIGPGYARRIISWREELGGFYSIQQLGDTYGLPDSTFQYIQAFLQESPVQKNLQINLATVKELQKHPYLNYRQAKAIVNYRNNHGNFSQWEDLTQVKALSEKTISAIQAYLTFE